MTAKEKAEELLDIMSKQTYKIQPYAGANYETEEIGYEGGKKCALIAVDEIINALKIADIISMSSWYINEWQEVKQEIEKL